MRHLICNPWPLSFKNGFIRPKTDSSNVNDEIVLRDGSYSLTSELAITECSNKGLDEGLETLRKMLRKTLRKLNVLQRLLPVQVTSNQRWRH